VEDFEGRIANAVERFVSHSGPTLADAAKKAIEMLKKRQCPWPPSGAFAQKPLLRSAPMSRGGATVVVLSRCDISLKQNMFKILLKAIV
jgi:hypothetical protein